MNDLNSSETVVHWVHLYVICAIYLYEYSRLFFKFIRKVNEAWLKYVLEVNVDVMAYFCSEVNRTWSGLALSFIRHL